MRLANPQWLWLSLVIPALVWWYWRMERKKKPVFTYSDLRPLDGIPGLKPSFWHHSVWILRCLAMVFVVLAMARPQAGSTMEEILTEGIDIVLALDVSTSMRAEDFKPKNRLHVAREVAKDFIMGRKNDRIGLVVFAAHSFTQCPLTLDYGTLIDLLDQIHTGMIEDGTAIGMGIATATNRLRESTAKSKVIILLTDGRNNRGEIDPITAAEAAHAEGVKIYTIGAGTHGKAPFPIDDPIFGRRYVEMDVEIDEESLTQVAGLTDGRYFRATDARTLAQIYQDISEMEKTEIETKEYREYAESVSWILLPSLLLLLLSLVLGEMRYRVLP